MTLFKDIDPVWLSIFAFVLGAFIGSFLNVCIYRIPRGESIVLPGSHCPKCKTTIRFYDNIPIVSYFLLLGRCRTCHAPLSLQYPLVELVTATLSWLVFERFGTTIDFVGYFALTAALIVVSGIDLGYRIIPDRISLSGIAAGLVFSLVTTGMDLLDSVVGMVAGGGSLLLVTLGYAGFVRLREKVRGRTHREETERVLEGLSLRELKNEAALYGIETENLSTREEIIETISEAKSEGMGGGDIKLLAMIGAFLGGWKSILFVILSGSFLGCVVGIPLMLLKQRDSKYAIPFGPFLSASAIIYILWGPDIIRWYYHLGR